MLIKAIGFDYLGVTALLGDRDIFADAGALLSVEREGVKAAYYSYAPQFQTNQLTQEQLWAKIAAELGVSEMLPQLLDLVSRGLPVIDSAVIKFIDGLRAAGYKVGLLSNMATGTQWDLDLRAKGVDRHFDAVVLSGDIGFSKPHPQSFEILSSRLGVETSELVFIDDRESSLIGIEERGITPIVYTGLENLKLKLESIGVTWESAVKD